MELYQFTQIINDPTRITESTRSLLDVCITSSPEKIISSGVIHLGISDHMSLIYAIRKLNYVPKIGARNLIEYRNFKYFNAESFLNDLCILPWIEIDKKENVDKMWECWKSLFVQVLDKHAPLKTKRVRKRGIVREQVESSGNFLKKASDQSRNVHWSLLNTKNVVGYFEFC